MNNTLLINVLPKVQAELFNRLAEHNMILNFYLAGGTSLALQIGHRQSIDFDFFIQGDFDSVKLIHSLDSMGEFVLFHQEKNTINGALNNVRISFFGYRYPTLFPFLLNRNFKIAHKLDIAAMKLEAIAGRGSKKDFVDLFFLLKEYSLSEIFDVYEKKYGVKIAERYHIFKSLVYFQDAEDQAMPKMLIKAKWTDIKKIITGEVKKLVNLF